MEISQTDLWAAMEEEEKRLRTPPKPPKGFLTLQSWVVLLNRSRGTVGESLNRKVRLGLAEKKMWPVLDSVGRVVSVPVFKLKKP